MRIETCHLRRELDGRVGAAIGRLRPRLGDSLRLDIVDVLLADYELPRPVAEEVLVDPVVQRLAEGPAPELPDFRGWDWIVEISYRPGVTDTLALTAREALAIAGAEPPEGSLVQTARLYLLALPRPEGRPEIEAAFAHFWNPLIQHASFLSRAEWEAGARLPELLPAVHLGEPGEPATFDLAAMGETELEALSSARLLALGLPEMLALRGHYADPATKAARAAAGLPAAATDVELEMVAQTWSEHCKHKIFNALIDYEGPEEGAAGSAARAAVRAGSPNAPAAPAAPAAGRRAPAAPRLVDSLFKTYIRGTTEALAPSRPDLLSVFTDNAGVVRFDEETAVCVKAETHNSPSALDPYGGAITGIVGVNRDIMGTGIGAAPLFNTDVLCFAPPRRPEAKVPAGLKHPAELLEGVHRGIVDGGNQSGIPTVGGAIVFDESYLGKPLVFCGTGGIMPAEIRGKPSWEKEIAPGMLAVMAGGRIGKDGIHGATFSSLALDEGSPATAVQVGDPIIQKRLCDFLLEARDLGLYAGITDNGAGGISSSLGEMAESSGGVRIDLDACPRKYPGLAPWEVLVSESQERMSLAVPKESWAALADLARRRGVEISAIGEFTGAGRIEILAGGRLVGLLPLDFLHRGLPRMRLPARHAAPSREALEAAAAPLPPASEAGALLLEVLAEPNVASKEAWIRQYDHEVKGLSVEKPLTGLRRDAPSDGAVLKPRYGSWRGLTVTHGLAPRLSPFDGRTMALAAVDEAYRAHIALGGDPDGAVALDNFCWPDPVESPANPDGAEKLGTLVRACEGLREACLAYGLPLVSGKDSMKNDAVIGGRRISVRPTLLVTLMGRIGDVRKALSTDFLGAGELLYLVGASSGELGGSILERVLASRAASRAAAAKAEPAGGAPARLPGAPLAGPGAFSLGPCPEPRPAEHLPLYRALHKAASGRLLRSCHDLSDGGLGAALAESCLGGRLGARVRLDGVLNSPNAEGAGGAPPGPPPKAGAGEAALRALFAEDPGRFLVSVREADRERFEATLRGHPLVPLGRTEAAPRLAVGLGGSTILDLDLAALEAAFKTPLTEEA